MSDSDESDWSDVDSDASGEHEEEEEEVIEEDKSKPPRIKDTANISDIAFHPSEYILGSGNLDGYVKLHRCVPDSLNEQLAKVRVSKESCRCTTFTANGKGLLVMTADKFMRCIDVETGKVNRSLKNAHTSSPYSIQTIDTNLVASGDEDGELKIWDLRKSSEAVLCEKQFEDYISDIAVDKKRRLIFATSADGTVATYNARQRKYQMLSDNLECEVMAGQVMKDNNKLVVGAGNGTLYLYNWDQFAATSDNFPLHKDPINSLAKVNENIVCTACADGKIRAINILPNRQLEVVGDHNGLPIEKVKTTYDGKFLASISHDSLIKFWNLEHLPSIKVSDHDKVKRTWQGGKKTIKSKRKKPSFFSGFGNDLVASTEGLSSSDYDSDSDDDE